VLHHSVERVRIRLFSHVYVPNDVLVDGRLQHGVIV
jgi:hypothetical protein